MENQLLLTQIFKRLYFRGSQSCSSLSRWMHRSNPSVMKLLNTLIAEDFVINNGYAPSTGGRPAIQYALNPDFGYIVAVAMDQLFTTIAVFDLSRKQITATETLELDLHDQKDALDILANRIQSHLQQSALPKSKIIGVGIAMPGLINYENGINYTFFEPQNPKTFLKEKLQLPIFIDNDSTLTALAEWNFGKALGAKNAMIVNMGWGTGLGMIVNGKPFMGETGYAGEFSHIPISDNGILCECGKRGCLETETSLLMMAERAIVEIEKRKDTGIEVKAPKYMSEVIMEAAAKGNQLCIHLLTSLGEALGKGLAILIHIMNPGLIVISGRGAKAQKIIMAPIQQALTQYCIPKLAENTKIVMSDLGQEAALIGAAALVIDHFTIETIAKENKTIPI